MSPLRTVALMALTALALVIIGGAIILARMAKMGDRNVDQALHDGTEHENGIGHKPKN